MRIPLPGRRGSLPRSTTYLAAVLAVALGVLFFLRRNPPPPDYTLGGRLFTASPDSIEGLLVTRSGAQYRIDRTASGAWTLSGAVSDFLDQQAVDHVLDKLSSATGGRLLPGSRPEDRRYEFNVPEAVRLTLFTTGGGKENLAIGARNPVTGLYYGSGAGRQACFPVSAGLRDLLAGLPGDLQLKTLLPPVDRQKVREIEVRRGSRSYLLRRRHRRWWLRMPAEGEAALGSWYHKYSSLYRDRREEEEGVTWLLADDQAARLIIHQGTRTIVKQILPPVEAARYRQELELDPPWRRIVLRGTGINPDPLAASADRLEITFAHALDQERVPAIRRGNVLITEPEAIRMVGEPLGSLLDSRALDFLISRADSLTVEREGRLLLRAHRDPGPLQPGKRGKERPVDFWLTDFPDRAASGLDQRTHDARSRNLLANLERMSALRILPPTRDPEVLKQKERVRLVVWYPDVEQPVPGEGHGRMVLEIGYLDEKRLPAGSPEPAAEQDGLAPVGLWRPATGQLLQIPGTTITTTRAWVLEDR